MGSLDDDDTPPEGGRATRTGRAESPRRSQRQTSSSLDDEPTPPVEDKPKRKPSDKGDRTEAPAPSPAPAASPTPAPAPAASSKPMGGAKKDLKDLPGLPGGLQLVRASDVPNRYLKILIFGGNGSGKTDAAVRGFADDLGDVVVMALEPQGMDTIISANPNAIVPGVKRDSDGRWSGGIRNMDQLRDFIAFAMGDSLREAGVKTIVLDGITEALNMIADEILEGKAEGKGGRKRLSQDDYGVVKTKGRALLKVLRDLPYHVICTALLDDEKDEETGMRLSKPLTVGSIRNEIGAYFNVVAYLYRQAQTPGTPARRYAMVDGGDRYSVKGHGGLTGIIRTPVSDWLRVMLGKEVSEPLTLTDAMPPDEYRRAMTVRGSDDTTVVTSTGSGGSLGDDD